MSLIEQAELAQLRKQYAKVMSEREQYVRLTALLVKAIETETEGALMRVDGHVAVRLEAFMAVPERYAVNVNITKVTDPGDAEAKEQDVLVLVVSDAKPKPILAIPNGVAR